MNVSLVLVFVGIASAGPQPLSLDEAWRLGARNNPHVKVAAEEASRARTLVHQGRALFYPVLEARTAMQWNDERIAFQAGAAEFVVQPWWTLQWQVSASQNLSFHGPALPLLRQARAIHGQAELSAAQARAEISFAIAQAYFAALAAESLAAMADEAGEAAGELLRVTRGRAEGGRATRVEVLRAELRVAEAEQTAAQARRALEDSTETLSDLIGEPGPFTLTRPPRPTVPADALEGDGKAAAVGRRPDVAAATRGVEGAEEARSAALRQFYPTLGLQALYAGYETSDGTLFGQSPDRYAVIGMVTIPIFDGNLKYWQLREKRAAVRASRARAAAVGAAAAADLRRARRRVTAGGEAESLARERLALAEQVRELVAGQYELGAATQLELLDADAARSAARREHVRAEYEADLAVLDLRRAMGLSLSDAATGSR